MTDFAAFLYRTGSCVYFKVCAKPAFNCLLLCLDSFAVLVSYINSIKHLCRSTTDAALCTKWNYFLLDYKFMSVIHLGTFMQFALRNIINSLCGTTDANILVQIWPKKGIFKMNNLRDKLTTISLTSMPINLSNLYLYLILK